MQVSWKVYKGQLSALLIIYVFQPTPRIRRTQSLRSVHCSTVDLTSSSIMDPPRVTAYFVIDPHYRSMYKNSAPDTMNFFTSLNVALRFDTKCSNIYISLLLNIVPPRMRRYHPWVPHETLATCGLQRLRYSAQYSCSSKWHIRSCNVCNA